MKRIVTPLAVALMAWLAVAGCAGGTVQSATADWLPPAGAVLSTPLPVVDMDLAEDVVHVAEYSTLIVRGHFVTKVADVDGLTLFGPADPKTEEEKALAAAHRGRSLTVWQLSVDKVLKGDVKFAGTTIYALVEQVATDVPGIAVDPSRVAKNEVVAMLHVVPVATIPYGPAYWINGGGNIGAGFVVVNSKGRISVDPWAKIPLRGAGRPTVPASAPIEQQLGISTSS
jgi:hypothetical protein